MNQRFCPHCGYDLQLDSAIMIDEFMMMSSIAPLWWGEIPVELTASERMICYTLMKAYPSPVRNEIMIDRLDSEAETGNVIAVYICRIRKKLRQAGVPNPIAATKGVSGRAYGWTTGREHARLSAS